MNFYKLNLLNIKIIYTFAKTHRKRNKLIKNKLEREQKDVIFTKSNAKKTQRKK